MSRKRVVVVLVGPAGVGKDSVIDELRKRTGIQRATSCTTRAPRANEREGRDYYFVTRDEFERKVAEGKFIEHAVVYGELKGVLESEARRLFDSNEDLIIRTDVQGARAWREKLESAVFVFLMAEDRETLRERLVKRKSETDDSLQHRLNELDDELADVPNNDYVLYNHHGKLEQAVDELAEIIEKERVNPSRPAPRLRS